MYPIIGKLHGHIECNSVECNSIEHSSTEEKNESKYLVFGSTNEKKEVFKKYTELWDGINTEIETPNSGKKDEDGKDFMETKFNTDDNLPLNKPLKLHLLTITVRCTLVEDGKFNCNFI